jgi:hypothetical protein
VLFKLGSSLSLRLSLTLLLFIINIKMDLLEIGSGGVYWMGLAQDRYMWRALVNAVMNRRVR